MCGSGRGYDRRPSCLRAPTADAILDRVLDPVRCDRGDDIAALAIRVEG